MRNEANIFVTFIYAAVFLLIYTLILLIFIHSREPNEAKLLQQEYQRGVRDGYKHAWDADTISFADTLSFGDWSVDSIEVEVLEWK